MNWVGKRKMKKEKKKKKKERKRKENLASRDTFHGCSKERDKKKAGGGNGLVKGKEEGEEKSFSFKREVEGPEAINSCVSGVLHTSQTNKQTNKNKKKHSPSLSTFLTKRHQSRENSPRQTFLTKM